MKSFLIGVLIGIAAMWLFAALIGPWSVEMSQSGCVRYNRITGKTERYYNGWQELK